jgi:hypothetical protein
MEIRVLSRTLGSLAMRLWHLSFGYYQPTSEIVRANKMDWTAVDHPLTAGLIRFVQEDEP